MSSPNNPATPSRNKLRLLKYPAYLLLFVAFLIWALGLPVASSIHNYSADMEILRRFPYPKLLEFEYLLWGNWGFAWVGVVCTAAAAVLLRLAKRRS